MWGGLADIAKGPLGDRLAQGLQAVGDIVAPIIDDEEDEDGNYDGDKSYSEMANAMFGDVGGGVVDGGGDGGAFIGVGQGRKEQPPPAASAPLQPSPNPNPSSPPRQERSESLQLEIRQLEDQLHESNNEYKHIMRENEKNISSLAAENASLKSWLADLESEGASVRTLQENNQQLESSLEQIQSIKQALALELVGVKTELEEMRQGNAKLGDKVRELGDQLDEAEAEKRRMEVIIVGSSNTKTPAKIRGGGNQNTQLQEQFKNLQEAHENLTNSVDITHTDSRDVEIEQLKTQLRDLREAHEGLTNSQDIRISRIMEEAEANVAKAKREASENDKEVAQLREIINNMRNSVSVSSDTADTYKSQLVSLQGDFERMSVDFEAVLKQNEESKEVISSLQNLSSSSTDLQLEMKALKKVLEGEKEKYKALEEERDDAEGRANEMRSRLVATSADLDIARNEAQQAQDSSNNLQMAMSKLQGEREAELGMMEQQRLDSLYAEQESWRTKLSAVTRLHEGEKQEIAAKHEGGLKAQVEKYKKQEARLDETRADNVTLRRSLDEAIGRLQATQDEVIDRTLMKNVLLDWHSKQGDERNAVMSIMASMLAFTDEEKNTAELYDVAAAAGKEGVVRRVMDNIAAPMPQPAVNVNELEGDTVSDKWKSFLLAEIGD
ncbi:hypothetical protein TL16_g03965 [Triparma laevis f. inornata]|uniref:GRIP domain-containing protein n=1 Tax=Triparma laevis f. inornata TaxID=1714386 RepID=A0A9W7E1E9_9STRA|nr:hypothetical protein TL16_g03965 [Triparma laevis f. inornata]